MATDARGPNARRKKAVALLDDEELAKAEAGLRAVNRARLDRGERPIGLGTYAREALLERAQRDAAGPAKRARAPR